MILIVHVISIVLALKVSLLKQSYCNVRADEIRKHLLGPTQ